MECKEIQNGKTTQDLEGMVPSFHEPRQAALHLVSARDTFAEEEYIITVYEPDPALWSDDFTRRRKE